MSQPKPKSTHVPSSLPDELLNRLELDTDAETSGTPSPHLTQESIYTDLIWNLTQLHYDFDEAKRHWHDVLQHKKKLNELIGRNVGIRVAAFDYFTNVVNVLQNPRVVDPSLLDRLYRDAVVDSLTQLPNRRAYSERLADEISRSARYHSSFVIAVFDVDNFKQVNDAHGHTAGDRILQMIANSMRESVRKSDFVARWGGEEFVVLMPETHKSGGLIFAERLRYQVSTDLASTGVTISGGLAAFPDDGDNEKELFAFADRALYRAKAEGKNRVCLTAHERRAYPRLDHNLPITLTPVPNRNPDVKTETFNVGVGGVAVRYPEAQPISASVHGEIDAGRGRIATFVGRVVFVEELESKEFELGIEFVQIDQAQWELIMANVR